ncbi:type IV pilus twitching motility protein PilT [Herbivorax sp. ANBcel31]|uniref:type IV pilus twitching motility protein PilT n=1 Tax=Herbivorax sp. ANBcel31 TaxID=3069754 RepID=UPI0027B7E76A|nr:type IV pilus twitching motility protein PilT [Herbivorax sp. ANBcel31]MDQ2087883.1 type IV pilus twitching motility protein PilT [Herbivorax sp. ANBcel31]
MELEELLRFAVEHRASDMHITVGRAPAFRINGRMRTIPADKLSENDTCHYARETLNNEKYEQLLSKGEVDYTISIPAISRFRVNAFFQKGCIAMAFRVLPSEIPTFEELGFPSIIRDICEIREGLILVTGPTGSGKSTTMASIIDEINSTKDGHILTLEDPIEFAFEHKKCIVNQREIGKDSRTYANALRSSLREDPDVIFIGEMRDVESMSIAVTAAETGNLVFSTLHTLGGAKTIDRLIDVFPADQQQQVRTQVAGALKAVISQRLIPQIDNRGRVAAFEIMMVTPAISNLIREGKGVGINSCIHTGVSQGMQLLDKDIAHLYKKGKISKENAYLYCADKGLLKRFINE